MHVCAADEAFALGGDRPATSYLDIARLLRAAEAAGADAIHPGSGFLAGNADFAQAVLDAGLVWIGPPPAALRAVEILVRPLHRGRRVETQCLADRDGNVAVLSTLDSSVRLGHRKLIEEAPAPFLTEEQDALLRQESRAILGKAGYVGAGSCEFEVAPDGTISFLGVVPRLGTAHPVIEEITGIDLVREQLRLAEGATLGYSDPQTRGHAIGFRVTAEDPGADFTPTPGTVRVFIPPSGPGVRLDTGVRPGSIVGPVEDPLLATLIVTGATRRQAIERAGRALSEFAVDGLPTTIPFHRAVIGDPAFRGEPSRVHTHWVETEFDNTITPYAGTHSEPEDAGRETVVVEVGGKRIEVSVPSALAVSAANAVRASARRRYVRERN